MSLIDELSQKVVETYKSGHPKERVFLQTLKAALINGQKETGQDLTPEDEVRILGRELKLREQSKLDFEKGGRADLVKSIDDEIALLKKYLPEQIGEKEIREIVRKKAESMDNPSFGQLMGASMADLKGRADGARVSVIVKEVLND